MSLPFSLKSIALILTLLALSPRCGAQIDTLVGCKAPRSESRDAERLAHYLCDGLSTDREKANAIYNWITHNIRYDIKAFVKGDLKHDRADRTLRRRKSVCEGYAYLFTEMGRAAGLQTVTVEGYARDWIFDNGDKLYVPRHIWNAVMIDGAWHLVDPTWGAGGSLQSPGWLRRQMNRLSKNPVQSGKLRFVFNYDTSYFLQDPEQFRIVHLPTDPIWQLTDTLMPASVFEAGRGAVIRFNEISEPAQQKGLLWDAADHNELMRTYAYAERAYAYNPRYFVPMALREQVDAEIQIQLGDSLNKTDPMPARYRYGKATRALGMSKEYLKRQKEGYTAEALELKQKNHKKNDAAKRHIREIRADNKRLMAQCTLKQRSATARQRQITTKEAALQRLAGDRRLKPDTKKRTSSPGTATIITALDSAAARNVRLAAMRSEADGVEAKLQEAVRVGRARVDSLAGSLELSDSLLVLETIARLNMHDNYDDDVIDYSTQFMEAKYRGADSMQKRYQRGYDSVLYYHGQRSKLEYARLMIYKSSLRSLAKYQQPGLSADAVKQYNILLEAFRTDMATYARHLKEYKQSVESGDEVFEALVKLYKRQDKITDYMERAEEKRKEQEEETLVKKEAFNKRENKTQQALVEKSMKRTKKLLGSNAI